MQEISKPLPSTPGAMRQPRITNPDPPRSKSRSPERIYHNNNNRNKSPTKTKQTKDNSNDITDNNEDDDEFEFFHEFNREKVKDVIHHITTFLKQNAMDTEYLMIPFRPEQNNEKLLKFLNAIFPLGNGQPVNEKSQLKIINKTDVWTLFQSLKYIWCRLPNSEIVGWKAYLKFKYKEIEKDYPQKAFLEIMPQCLESPNHASIVYDFFDLIVTLSSNSRINKMSARKVAKMCAIWAFKKTDSSTMDGTLSNDNSSYDFDEHNTKIVKINNSFQDGINQWIPASDAMFHLLLAFLKSFVPKDLESSKLPKSLKSVLFNNDYPPKGSTAYTSQTILTIPLVTLYTDKFSRKPWQLLERCNDLLDFSDYDAFEAREDYALLKSLFKKKNNVEGISRKMSQESRRLMKIMSTKHSTFQAGWAPRQCLPNKYEQGENIEIQRVDIDDYFIWAWLSTLSYEETSQKKKIFGRSLILEFEFDGFKKWVIFQECDITLDYESKGQLKKKNPNVKSHSNESDNEDEIIQKKKPLPEMRNVTPVYEKFQNEVPNKSVMKTDHSVLTTPSTTPQGQFHTVIDKSALQKNNKNNLHVLEEKISKWNPLHNLRKKSNSSASDERSNSISSSETRKEFASSSIYDPTQSRTTKPETFIEQPHAQQTSNNNNHRDNPRDRVISQYSLLDPTKYKLPDFERGEGFDIDLSSITEDTDTTQPEPVPMPKQSSGYSRTSPVHNNKSTPQAPITDNQLNYGKDNRQTRSNEQLPIQQYNYQKTRSNEQLPIQQNNYQQTIPNEHLVVQENNYPLSHSPERHNTYNQVQPNMDSQMQPNMNPPVLTKPTSPAYMSQTSITTSSNSSNDRKGRASATETLEELSDMVEDMMLQDNVLNVEAEKTFEGMTKFDQYKPKEFDAESSTSSAVQSLQIATPTDERQKSLQNLHSGISSGTNYRERINFNDNGRERRQETNTGNIYSNNDDSYRENPVQNRTNNNTNEPSYSSNRGRQSTSPERGPYQQPQGYRNQNGSPVRSHPEAQPYGRQNMSPVRNAQTQEQLQQQGYPRQERSLEQGNKSYPEQNYQGQGQGQPQPLQKDYPRENVSPVRVAQPPQHDYQRQGRLPGADNKTTSGQNYQQQQPPQGTYPRTNGSPSRNNQPPAPQSYQRPNMSPMRANQGQPQPQGYPQGQGQGQGEPQGGYPRPNRSPHSKTQGYPSNPKSSQQQQPQYTPQQPQYTPQQPQYTPQQPQYTHQQPNDYPRQNLSPQPPQQTGYPRQNLSPQSQPPQQGGYPRQHLSPQPQQNGYARQNISPNPSSNSSAHSQHSFPRSNTQPQFMVIQQQQQQPMPNGNNYYPPNNYIGASSPQQLQPQYNNTKRHNMGTIPNGLNNLNQADGYASYVHPSSNMHMHMNSNDNGGEMIPNDIPMAVAHNTMGMKLHGNNINRRQERKQLYDNIRSGNFGI